MQIVISYNKPENALENYQEHWQIETAFSASKSGGFNIEDKHLTEIKRIEKLFAVVMVAFTWAYLLGDFLNKDIKTIAIKKHDKKAKSIIKFRLTYITSVLINKSFNDEIGIYQF